MQINWELVKQNLEQMGVPFQERPCEESLQGFIKQCGYQAHPMVVNLTSISTVNAEIGVIVTHEDEDTNNGVYIFCVLADKALGLVTVIPSTVSKGAMVRKLSGDITNAVTSVDTPPLTAFDIIEITGQVIANTVMKDLMVAFNIPKEKEQMFVCMYLPKFLANVALYYTGAVDKDKKPLVVEEIADMEPLQIRQIIMDEKVPDAVKDHIAETSKTEKEASSC